MKALCILATIIGLALLASILFTLLWRGGGGLSVRVFTTVTLPPGSNGGLLNAIVGTLIQTAVGTLIGTPIEGSPAKAATMFSAIGLTAGPQ